MVELLVLIAVGGSFLAERTIEHRLRFPILPMAAETRHAVIGSTREPYRKRGRAPSSPQPATGKAVNASAGFDVGWRNAR